MSLKIIKSDIRYLIFNEIYFRLENPKSKRKAFTILEAAITCFYRKTWSAVTMEMIAREAGISRPALKTYFDTVEEIRIYAIKYIRLLFQKYVVNQIIKSDSPQQMLEIYLKSCFAWVENFKVHSVVWLSFLQSCSTSMENKKINTLAVNAGTERLAEIIFHGKKLAIFRCSDVVVTAKMIQVFITGAMIALGTEDFQENAEAFKSNIIKSCLALAQLN